MEISNGQKSKHGKKAQNTLLKLIEYSKDKNYIKSFQKEYRVGKSGFTNKKQFYAPFIIEFTNNEKWIIFSSTSMRTDRIKGQQWDALNTKEINPSITV